MVCVGKGVEAQSKAPEGFQKLKTKDDMDNFNQSLGTEDNFKNNIHKWLDESIKKAEVKDRVHKTHDLIFDPELLTGCNWKGGPSYNPKIP